MALKNYVISKYMSGTSAKDIELDINQLVDGESYEIADPISFIAENIYYALEQSIHPKYTENVIYQLLQHSGKYILAVYDADIVSSIDSITLVVDNANGVYYYDVVGTVFARQIYEVSVFDDADVGYLVVENIIHPEDNCELIRRCYEPYFLDIYAARKYRNEQMKHYKISHGSSNSGFRIIVVDVNKIVESDWYRLNLEVANDIISYKLDPERYRYIPDIAIVHEAILADAYEDLDDTAKASVNRDIYDMIKPYIPCEYVAFLDDDLNISDDSEIEDIVNQAITICLTNVKSEEEFFEFHDLLGPYEYRIGCLTDDIYNAHPDSGYIVVSKDGDMGWYESCYAINEWSGAEDNPWFGKFQLNENNTLQCFREYRPDLIASKLPKKSDIQKYEEEYQEANAKIRRVHREMRVVKNEDGDEIVIGTWYCNGLKSDKKIDRAMFFKDYGSHFFTEEECKQLLNGEEITIEHFVTKMKKEVTIRGKLKDVSSMFDNDQRIEFVRTDIDANKRKKLNSELGIDEPGLPPVEPADGEDN